MNTLSLRKRIDCSTKKAFYDFVIDNNSLFDLCDMEGTNRIGILGWGTNKVYEQSIIKQYLNLEKNNELDSKRIMAFVCSECGDIGCGGTTFKLTETDSTIIWSDFGDEDQLEAFNEVVDKASYEKIGPFVFEKEHYKKVFEDYYREIKTV